MPLQALMALQDAIRRHRHSSRLHLVAGMILTGQDRLDDARRHFLRAAERDCSCYEAYRYLGLCDASQGKFAPAVSHLTRALSQRPADLSLARETLTVAKAAMAEGLMVRTTFTDHVGATLESDLDRLAELILTENDFAVVPLGLPVSEADEEIFGVFSTVMDVVLARHGEYADMQHRQAMMQQRLGRPQRALTHVLKALAVNPTFVQARFLAGALLLDTDPTAAAEHLRRAVAAGGDYADVHATLGTAYERLGRTDAARVELRRSLEINNSYAPAAEALKRLVA
jgi:tetratricopeptide (TPR) repeat protein